MYCMVSLPVQKMLTLGSLIGSNAFPLAAGDNMRKQFDLVQDLSVRNRDVFRTLVENYLESGTPVGSRTLSRDMEAKISPATIRNVMQDLEFLGLLVSPHISAGRIPTEIGLRVFVDEFLEVDEINAEERQRLESIAANGSKGVAEIMAKVGLVLSGLTHSASLVLTPKSEAPIKHVEFVSLASDRALVVLVTADGQVENRLFRPPAGQTPSAMREAANFVNAIARGRTISELQETVAQEVEERRSEIDRIASELAKRGLAVWDTDNAVHERLIVRGRSNLLDTPEFQEDLDKVRELFDDMERKRDIADLLKFVEEGEGVKIFIGSENKLFSMSGSTLVISPYMNGRRKVIGAVGVVGPTRLNYGRIVPIVDYTAQLVGKLMSNQVSGGQES